MKQGIHPNWNHQTQVTCACGNSFTTGSVTDTVTVDICSACHPFFTGEMKFVDKQGRVDKFMQRVKNAQTKQKSGKGKKKTDDQADQKSYKQLLQEQRQNLKKTTKAA